MKVVNFYSGPCSGKSTIAANLFARLKSHHIETELVGEFAKELIYRGNEIQLLNQVYVLGSQYRKLKDLERHKIDIAISDSPLMLQMVYCRKFPYFKEILELTKKLNGEFDNIDVFINRKNPYQMYGRVTTEQEALVLDKDIREFMKNDFHYDIDADSHGVAFLEKKLLQKFDKELLDKF